MSGMLSKMQDSPPKAAAPKQSADTERPAWASLTQQQTAPLQDSPEAGILTRLVQDVLDRDQTAIVKFTELFYGLIHRIATEKALQIKDPTFDDKDLAQGAWQYIVYGIRIGKKSKHPLRTWLFDQRAPLRHYVAYQVRKYSKDFFRHMRGLRFNTVPLAAEADSPDIDPQLTRRYQECWSKLSETDRPLFDLVYLQGEPRHKVATKFGMSLSTLCRRLSDIERAFTTCLESSSFNT